jgi:hypothetical protein
MPEGANAGSKAIFPIWVRGYLQYLANLGNGTIGTAGGVARGDGSAVVWAEAASGFRFDNGVYLTAMHTYNAPFPKPFPTNIPLNTVNFTSGPISTMIGGYETQTRAPVAKEPPIFEDHGGLQSSVQPINLNGFDPLNANQVNVRDLGVIYSEYASRCVV